MKECCGEVSYREVLERSVGEHCCREVLEKSVVEKCCTDEKCCGEVL